jgi:uncharacterized membrane protein YjjP (DUF1212 family)
MVMSENETLGLGVIIGAFVGLAGGGWSGLFAGATIGFVIALVYFGYQGRKW